MRRSTPKPAPRPPAPTPPEETIVHVVGAAIVEGGRCLVAQRGAAMSSPWLWELPGGKVEPGEDPRQALAREIREELGLEIDVGAWLGRGTSRVGGRRIELEVFLARPRGGALRLAEHHACRWLAAAELDGLEWTAADLHVLPACKAHLESGDGDGTANSPEKFVSPLDRPRVRI